MRKLIDVLWDVHDVFVYYAIYAICGIALTLGVGSFAVRFAIGFWQWLGVLQEQYPPGTVPIGLLVLICAIAASWLAVMLSLFMLLRVFISIVWRQYRHFYF